MMSHCVNSLFRGTSLSYFGKQVRWLSTLPPANLPVSSFVETHVVVPTNSCVVESPSSSYLLPARHPSHKLALIIGNDEYNVAERLSSCVKDARDVMKVLKSKGFETKILENATNKEVQRALLDMGLKRMPNDLLLFYFSGHGIEYSGRNFMLNITPKGSMQDAIMLPTVLTYLCGMAENSSTILINDACHHVPGIRPLALNKGDWQIFTDVPPTKSEFLFEFSTSSNDYVKAGTVDKNSLYTSYLLPLLSSGMDAVTLFSEVRRQMKADGHQQISWTHLSLTHRVFF